MLLLQYSRQAAYLQCRISNSLAAIHCDCEKIIAGAGTDDSHESPLNNTPKLHLPDEMLFTGSLVLTHSAFDHHCKKPTTYTITALPGNFPGELFEPPKAF